MFKLFLPQLNLSFNNCNRKTNIFINFTYLKLRMRNLKFLYITCYEIIFIDQVISYEKEFLFDKIYFYKTYFHGPVKNKLVYDCKRELSQIRKLVLTEFFKAHLFVLT